MPFFHHLELLFTNFLNRWFYLTYLHFLPPLLYSRSPIPPTIFLKLLSAREKIIFHCPVQLTHFSPYLTWPPGSSWTCLDHLPWNCLLLHPHCLLVSFLSLWLLPLIFLPRVLSLPTSKEHSFPGFHSHSTHSHGFNHHPYPDVSQISILSPDLLHKLCYMWLIGCLYSDA